MAANWRGSSSGMRAYIAAIVLSGSSKATTPQPSVQVGIDSGATRARAATSASAASCDGCPGCR